jgi:hypothetical protein
LCFSKARRNANYKLRITNYELRRHFNRDFFINGNAAIRADGGAEGAAGAIVVGVQQDDGAVALAVQIVSQGDNVLGAGGATQFAPFTAFNINNYATMGHGKSSEQK